MTDIYTIIELCAILLTFSFMGWLLVLAYSIEPMMTTIYLVLFFGSLVVGLYYFRGMVKAIIYARQAERQEREKKQKAMGN